MFVSSAAFAETINFKTGRSVQAKILEKEATSIKADVNGMTMTYYADEIKDIDGKALDGSASVADSPTPSITATKITPAGGIKEDRNEKRALILKFIDVFGTRNAMTKNFDTLMNALAEQKPKDAKVIREKFKIDEVIERIIPLYDKYFTSEELKTYIEFYSSPKGQKLITNIGSVMKDTVDVGTKYLNEKFPEIMAN